MTKAIFIILTLAGFASGAEMEVTDRLSVDGSSLFKSTAVFSGSVGVGTAAVSNSRLAVIGSTETAYSLAVGTSTNYNFAVSTGGNLQAAGDGRFGGTVYKGTYTVLDSSMLDANGTMKVTGIQNTGATAGISVSAPTADRGLDYMEYSSTAEAQAAYVSNALTASDDSYTKLLIHFNGSDAATSYTAETGQILTFLGTAYLDAAHKEFGSASLSLNGNSDYVTVPNSDDWCFGAGDFTIDSWVMLNTLSSTQRIVSQGTSDNANRWQLFYYSATGGFSFECNSGGSSVVDIYTGDSLQTGVWYHVAVVRHGSTVTVYRDGVSKGSGSATRDFPNIGTSLIIGKDYTSGNYLNGYIDELRISKGIARWTSNFTPPTYEYATLQDFSEPAIKTQGSYAMKGMANTGALNKTLARTVSPTIDLSGRTQINFDIRSSTTGSNIKISLRKSGGTAAEITPNIISADTWQRVNWDISAVTASSKNAIDSIIVTIASAPVTNTFYIDNMYAPGNGNNDITFTSGSERMRIDSSGNVGIGTTSPSVKLEVNGDIKGDAIYTYAVMLSADSDQFVNTGYKFSEISIIKAYAFNLCDRGYGEWLIMYYPSSPSVKVISSNTMQAQVSGTDLQIKTGAVGCSVAVSVKRAY